MKAELIFLNFRDISKFRKQTLRDTPAEIIPIESARKNLNDERITEHILSRISNTSLEEHELALFEEDTDKHYYEYPLFRGFSFPKDKFLNACYKALSMHGVQADSIPRQLDTDHPQVIPFIFESTQDPDIQIHARCGYDKYGKLWTAEWFAIRNNIIDIKTRQRINLNW